MTKTPVLLAIALVSTAWAADDAYELPTSAQAIVDKAARTIAANRARYDAANNGPLADTEKALKAKQAELAKAGKLEDALAIQKFLEVFRTEVVASVDDRANANGDAPETVKVSRKLLVGKWKRNDEIYSVQGNRNPFVDRPEFVGMVYGYSIRVKSFSGTFDGNGQLVPPDGSGTNAMNFRVQGIQGPMMIDMPPRPKDALYKMESLE